MAGNSGESTEPEKPGANSDGQSNPEKSGAADAQPQVTPPAPPKKPTARAFSCTRCGASVTIKYPGASMSVVCSSCGSVIDVTDSNYEILNQVRVRTDFWQPDIPLGRRGKLSGKTWECIGFMVRDDAASKYFWKEYLLFNPYYGYRWLVEDKGKWTFVKTIKTKPDLQRMAFGMATAEAAVLKDQIFRIYNRGRTEVNYVLGEFYWRVIVGSMVSSTDYIAPPQMLSSESDDTEVVWSLGEYIDGKEIAAAFDLIGKLPLPVGMGAIEPSQASANWKKIWPSWVVFLTFLTCAQFFFATTAKNATATQFYGNFIPNTKIADVTVPKFTLEKNSANVVIQLTAPVSNSWFWVSGELVNNDTGASYPFEMTSEYYFGSDEDGPWSEGSQTHDIDFSSVPGGDYYINIDAESGDFKDLNEKQYTIVVHRDVALFSNYWWFVFFVSITPIYCWAMMRRDEVGRWANSDYSPFVSSS